MSIVLEDPIHPVDAIPIPVRPTAPLDPGTTSGERGSPSSSNPAVATVERWPDRSPTSTRRRIPTWCFAAAGELIRVPLRDIKKRIESVA